MSYFFHLPYCKDFSKSLKTGKLLMAGLIIYLMSIAVLCHRPGSALEVSEPEHCSVPWATCLPSGVHSSIHPTNDDGGLSLCQALCWALRVSKQKNHHPHGACVLEGERENVHIRPSVRWRKIKQGDKWEIKESLKEKISGDRREVRDKPGGYPGKEEQEAG